MRLALGAVYGGATVCAWYPITPSSSVAEAFQKYCSRYRVDKASGPNKFAIVQAEDEIRLDRHRHRCRLETAHALHLHLGAGRVR
jgi:pyruvate/2-oxoacid:ferredoxin oxidoreductase alpha subunit